VIRAGDLAITAITQNIPKQYVATVYAAAHHRPLAIPPSDVLGFSEQPADYPDAGLVAKTWLSESARATVVGSTYEPRWQHVHPREYTVEPHHPVRHMFINSVSGKPTEQRPVRPSEQVLRVFVTEYFRHVQHLRR
jgi:hypothetical protein